MKNLSHLFPSFAIGDIVEIGGEYAGDWRGTLHYVGEVSWNKKKNRIEYGTYQIDTNDGMTDGWGEEHLSMVKPSPYRTALANAPQVVTDADDDVFYAISMRSGEWIRTYLKSNGLKITAAPNGGA